MHATLDRTTESGDDALFFADLPDLASDRMVVQPAEPRTAYGAGRKLNWPAILLIAALHIVVITALIRMDVIVIKKKPQPLVVDLIAEAAPPPADVPPEPRTTPEEIVPQLVTPPQIVETAAPPPPQLVVAPPPVRPAPVAAPSPAMMVIGNLDEKMISGNPPRYPMESRRKREQGTVLLRLLIGTDGRVAQVSIAESSGFERLDQAALQAARSWRWQPMIRDGQPVEVRGTMPITFGLPAKA